MNLKEKIIECCKPTLEGIEIFLFGSILYTNEENNDIDIAIIYDRNIINIETAINIRKAVHETISKITDLTVDILLLSQEENDEVQFIKNTKSEKII